MNSLILNLFIIGCFQLISFILSEKCPIKRCSSVDDDYNLPDKQCIFYHQDANQVDYFEIDHTKCSSNEICQNTLNINQNSTCTFRQGTALDRSPCISSDNCYSNICKDNKCEGLGEGVSCLINSQCKVGLFCNSTGVEFERKCVKQAEKDSYCKNDLQCKNNYGCNMLTKSCVPYLSLPDDSPIYTGDTANTLLCESRFARNGVCASTYLLSNDECGTDQVDCDYSYKINDKNITFKMPCECSPIDPVKKYCRMPSTHTQYKEFVKSLKQWFIGKVNNEHTITRFNYPKELRERELSTVEYPKFRGADACLLKFYSSAKILQVFGFIGVLFLLIVVYV